MKKVKEKKAQHPAIKKVKFEAGAAAVETALSKQFVISAIGYGFLTGLKDPAWSTDRSKAMVFENLEQATTSLNARRTSSGFPNHAGISPWTQDADQGAAAALTQHFPRLQEVEAAPGSPYKILKPVEGVKPEDLTVAERTAIAERLNLTTLKMPKYIGKMAPSMGASIAEAKASALMQDSKRSKMLAPDMRDKMEKVGKGAAAIMQKAEAERKAAGKPPKEAKERFPKAAAAKAKANGAARPAGRGIGAFCEGLLLKKKTAEEILAAVRKKFPEAKTSMASIAWYRNKLTQEGQLKKED